ncbi:MAG: ferritin family protein [candidate division WOR-3 bacterium]
MPIFYSPVEVIELAVNLEQGGMQFYRTLSQNTQVPTLKKLFTFLAREESKHQRIFKNLYKKIKTDPSALAYDFDEMRLYLKAITDSHFFHSPQSALHKIKTLKSPKKILSYAVDFEKETVLFYLEISKMIKPEDQTLVTEIINQERGHIKKLTEIKESI